VEGRRKHNARQICLSIFPSACGARINGGLAKGSYALRK